MNANGSTSSRVRPGVLVRRVSIRVLEVSRAGCLIESTMPMAEGTVGLLEILLAGRVRIEPFRICRTDLREGAVAPYRAAAQFLAVASPSDFSVRQELGALEAALVESARLGTKSHSMRTNSRSNDDPDADDEAYTAEIHD